jgi:hypothetical protein
MGTYTDEKQAGGAMKKAGPAAMPPGMSTADHTTFVDLMLQEVAQSAKDATGAASPAELLRAASQTFVRARAAVASYSVPDTGTSSKQLMRSVDGAFMGLFDLFTALQGNTEPSVAAYANYIQAAMIEMNHRFEPIGWKPPRSATEGQVRAKQAAQVGVMQLTTAERGQLGRLHLRAAQQYILGNWEQISAGDFAATRIAHQSLSDAMTILVDPRLASEGTLTADIAATEQVIARLVMAIEQNAPQRLGELRELGTKMDALLGVVNRDPAWGARIARSAPNASAIKEPPSADQPMHRVEEPRHWYKKVHIKDTNYFDEYLGYVELFVEAYRTPSGQVYVQRATATKRLTGRAQQYLSIGANISATSVEVNGQRFADVYFDVQVGGPNTTETSGVAIGGKITGSNAEKTIGGELSATVTFATAVASQGTAAFRRVLRVQSLDKPVMEMLPNPLTNHKEPTSTQMSLAERKDLHSDFSGFTLDDDHVGDEPETFYADWELHSYSD